MPLSLTNYYDPQAFFADFSTKTLQAISSPRASFEPLTEISTGPLSGAIRLTLTLVPGVKPMSNSLRRTLLSPRMKATVPF